jgi:Cof subfamily protein (haloacid dehalogenase superfamily)
MTSLSNIHVIALDLDDTALRSDHTMSPYTLDLLQRWRAAGKHVIIATGRPPRSVGAALPEVLHDLPWICYNGAEARQNGRTILRDLIPTEDARYLVSWGLETLPDWFIGIEIDDEIYLNRRLPRPKQCVIEPDLLSVIEQPAAKVLFFLDRRKIDPELAPADVVFAAVDPLLASLPERTRPMLSRRYGLAQFLSNTADKAVALRHLVEGLGYSMENVMAFGDDINDVQMVAEAGVGIAVHNAVAEVHDVADRVTASNDEDGVALVIEELLKNRL